MAQQIGATVEDNEGNPWASALDGLRRAGSPEIDHDHTALASGAVKATR